ncbi:MAG: VWA domain-containing protein [Hyphomicrobiales bacterium]|nr:MAG: VWA domain-containing protein [Hyphomicrobiales bacterium]
MDEIDVVLKPGSNIVDASLPEAAAGDHVIEASLVGGTDSTPLNDRSALAVDVAPRPMVAVVTSQIEWGETFARALALQGIDARVMLPGDAPVDLKGWLGYAVVALMNVPAIDLGRARQNQLEHYVRVNGRGLLMLGGENSFGPGGYYATPLEAMSPLSARVPKDLPAAAMGFVLDRSGSMKADVGGITRLDIAKSATLNAVQVLNEKNQVSIVVFDTRATLLVPMQDRKDVAAVEAALRRVAPGGGTSIAPGLSKMMDEMGTSRSRVRHIVVMSDGQSQGGDLIALTRTARSRGMTISAVAIGSEADVATLQTLARDGGGSFYFTEDFRSLPSILSQEAIMLSGVRRWNFDYGRMRLWGSLAFTLIGGTIGGTALTLIFLPALYAIWFRIKPAVGV